MLIEKTVSIAKGREILSVKVIQSNCVEHTSGICRGHTGIEITFADDLHTKTYIYCDETVKIAFALYYFGTPDRHFSKHIDSETRRMIVDLKF